MDEVPKEAVVIAFLPTYAGGYERMFKRLGEIFTWDEPRYGMIDEERKKRTILKMMERDYLYLDDRVYPGLPMVAVVRKARMKPVYIYSNMPALQLAVLKQQRHSEFVPFARLSDEDEVTPASQLTIIPTSNAVVNYYRDVYLSKGVGIPADGEAPFAVAVDGKVFGFLIYCQDAGAGRRLPPGRLCGQFHSIPATGETPAPGDSDQGDSPDDGRKAPGGDSFLHAPWCSPTSRCP